MSNIVLRPKRFASVSGGKDSLYMLNLILHNTRCGCMFCPLSSLQNLKYLYRYYPNEFEKYICFCEETEKIREKELGHPFSVRSSNPKYNAEYTRKRVIELCSKMR